MLVVERIASKAAAPIARGIGGAGKRASHPGRLRPHTCADSGVQVWPRHDGVLTDGVEPVALAPASR